MNDQTYNSSKPSLIISIQKCRETNQILKDEHSERAKDAQFNIDMCDAAEKVITYVADASGAISQPVTAAKSSFDSLDFESKQALERLREIPTMQFASATTTASVSGAIHEINNVGAVTDKAEFEKSVSEYQTVVYQRDWINEVKTELCRLGLNIKTSPHKKSPFELFRNSEEEFQSPTGAGDTPIPSLIPIRECINGTLEALLRRRPKQEGAKQRKEKVRSILNQVGVSNLTENRIQELACEADQLNGRLSKIKQDAMDREEIRHLFYETCAFLVAFLGYIDINKLKSV